MAVSRQTVREAMKVEMDAYYTVAEAGYAYKPDDLGDDFPVFAIESSSSFRNTERFAAVGSVFQFTIHHFVLYANAKRGWTKQNADDALDDMELAWATFLQAKKSNQTNWRNIQVTGESVIFDNIDMGGERYIDEQIPIQVEV